MYNTYMLNSISFYLYFFSYTAARGTTRAFISILIAEVVLAHPYEYKYKTTDRAKAWQQVAEAMQKRGYRVDSRDIRDRINILKDQIKAKNNMERAATGIAMEETEEEKMIREAVEVMIQEEEDIELAPKEKGDEEKKADGAEVRRGPAKH